MPKRKTIKKPLPSVIENMEDWPIYVSYNKKKEFLDKVKAYTIEHAHWIKNDENGIRKELKNILYQEKMRLSKTPWKSDDPK